jgi:HK97 family phage portal protein
MNLNQKPQATVERFYTNNAQSQKYLQFNGTNLSIIQEAVKVFESTYSGVENAFKLPLLPPNTEIKELQSQINDDKFLQTASFSEKTIASAFGVPIHFLGHSEQKFSNFEQQALSFKQNTISSLVAIIKSELEFKLLTLDEIKAGIHIDIDVEKLIDTSLIEKANYIKTAISSGTMTPNEGCQRMGTKPYDTEFGDYHFIQMQNIPIEKYDIYHNNTALNAQNSDNSGDKASEDIIINNNPDAKGDN